MSDVHNFLSTVIKQEYRSPQDNIIRDFYLPVLNEAVSYKRSVGFFSSTALVEISKGICELARKGGTINLVASPKLSEDDLKAIEIGYQNRTKIIEKALLRSIDEPTKNIFASERLNLLANLIEQGVLNIKIAFTEENNTIGFYHEKLGLIEDSEGNKIAFSGSMNETENAMKFNYESVDVFCSWKSEDENSRVVQKEKAFSRIWGNYDQKLRVQSFPAVNKALLEKFKRNEPDYDIDKKETKNNEYKIIHESSFDDIKVAYLDSEDFFEFSDGKKPRPHQEKAIEKFKENNYQCLFAMATGTGKTLTAIFAANELSKKKRLEDILILVPLKDLVDQWYKDISTYFKGTILQIRSGNDWKEQLSRYSVQKILSPVEVERLVVISTYDSFSINQKRILDQFNLCNTLIIADECHKTGASTYRKNLCDNIPYRIGLSATPKRPFDLKGTKAIFDYFDPNNNPYEFTIKMAIENNMLCHYDYHPIIVELNNDEMYTYAELSERISKISMIVNSDSATEEDDEKLERLLKQRHRIIERADNKYDKFISIFSKEIERYKNNTIVFAPDGTDENDDDILSLYKDVAIQEARKLNIYLTALEYVQGTSKEVLDHFAKGQVDMVFAKQRLNEGIDIPSARRAFFIASSTSEREFIQRRGRVLRLSEGKKLAEIFDFIVIAPKSAKEHFNERILNQIKENELKRAMNFAETADNFSEIANKLKEYM
jgi:superfamily II DNA or RNA helicase